MAAELRRFGCNSIEEWADLMRRDPKKWQKIEDELEANTWLAENAISRKLTVMQYLRMVAESGIRE